MLSLRTRMRALIAPGARPMTDPAPPPLRDQDTAPPRCAPTDPAHRAGPAGHGAEGEPPADAGDDGRLVGSVTGSELLGISRDRFVRLARAGCFRPSRWYVNHYRAVVWLYPADEVTAFAEEHPDWMTGRLPEEVRARLDDGLDLRAAGWRTRQATLIAARSGDDWRAAAVWLALLGAERAADLLPDDAERTRLAEARPSLLTGRRIEPEEASAVPLVARDPEEIAFARLCLAAALDRVHATGAATSRPGPAPNLCSRTVTRQGQRPRWPRSLSTRRGSAPRRPARARAGRGDRRAPARPVRPDQSKGRR